MEIGDLKKLFETYSIRESGSKEKKLFGMEYENFIFVPKKERKELHFLPLSLSGEPGIFSVLNKLAKFTENSDDPLERVFENDMLLLLKRASGSKITIEPGCQIELSDAPRSSILEANIYFQNYIKLLKKTISSFNGKLFFQGVQPLHSLEQIPIFPKKRYRTMFPYMLKTGSLGQWMMKASSGIQISIDYNSIEDLQRKFVFLNRLSPFLTAIFANSPLVEGRWSGYLSYRSHIWQNTDKTRSGLQKIFLMENFVIEDYIEWALKTSPYHLMQNGREIQTTKWSFKKLLKGEHPEIIPNINNWEEHLGMLFPDVRIKNIIEIRVFDSLSPKFSMAIPALIGSLIYNESVFSKVQSIIMDLPIEDYPIYKKAAAKEALKAQVNRTNFKKICLLILEKAMEGLGSQEENWLIPFFENYSKEGSSPADKTLEIFKKCDENPNAWFENVLKEEDY